MSLSSIIQAGRPPIRSFLKYNIFASNVLRILHRWHRTIARPWSHGALEWRIQHFYPCELECINILVVKQSIRQAKAMFPSITALLSLFAATVGVRCASIIPPDSFSSISTFEAYWNYLYPWGSDHNGSTWALHTAMILISWNRQVLGWKGTPQTIAILTRLRARFRWLLHQHLIPHHPLALQIPTQQFTMWGMVVLYSFTRPSTSRSDVATLQWCCSCKIADHSHKCELLYNIWWIQFTNHKRHLACFLVCKLLTKSDFTFPIFRLTVRIPGYTKPSH